MSVPKKTIFKNLMQNAFILQYWKGGEWKNKKIHFVIFFNVIFHKDFGCGNYIFNLPGSYL